MRLKCPERQERQKHCGGAGLRAHRHCWFSPALQYPIYLANRLAGCRPARTGRSNRYSQLGLLVGPPGDRDVEESQCVNRVVIPADAGACPVPS